MVFLMLLLKEELIGRYGVVRPILADLHFDGRITVRAKERAAALVPPDGRIAHIRERLTGGIKERHTVKVNDGSDLKFMPVGVPGVMVKAVKVGNTVLTPDAEGYYTLSAVSKDITVSLEKATAVTLTFKAPTAGAYISVNGGANQLVTDTATYAVSVASGSTVTLTIVPASGQTVSAVTSTGNFVSGSANSYSIVAAATGEVVIAY